MMPPLSLKQKNASNKAALLSAAAQGFLLSHSVQQQDHHVSAYISGEKQTFLVPLRFLRSGGHLSQPRAVSTQHSWQCRTGMPWALFLMGLPLNSSELNEKNNTVFGNFPSRHAARLLCRLLLVPPSFSIWISVLCSDLLRISLSPERCLWANSTASFQISR